MLLNQNYKDVEMLIQQWLFWVPVYVCVCACLCLQGATFATV